MALTRSGNVHFIGRMPDDPPAGMRPPPFWGELDGSRPVVHVTQGTLANTAPTWIAPALEALANEDALVVVSTGNRPIEELGLGTTPKRSQGSRQSTLPRPSMRARQRISKLRRDGARRADRRGDGPAVGLTSIAGNTEPDRKS